MVCERAVGGRATTKEESSTGRVDDLAIERGIRLKNGEGEGAELRLGHCEGDQRDHQ